MTKPILYHQHGCGMCRAIEMLLNKKGIEFDSILITTDNVEEFREKGILATPTLEVDGHRYVKKDCLDWINGR